MGIKAKKAIMEKLKKGSSQLSFVGGKDECTDFLPLQGGPGCKLPKSKTLANSAKVLYVARIPHGFYETEMEGFFKQFGTIKRLRLARNKKDKVKHPSVGLCHVMTGKSKHFGFIEFESSEERTLEEQKKLMEGILKRDLKRQKMIEVAGIDYLCSEIVSGNLPAPKKIRFDEE